MKTINFIRFLLLIWVISALPACKNSDNSFSPELIPFKLGDKWGYANSDGKYEINPQFSYAGYFAENLALVCSSDKYGYIDPQGQYAIKLQFKDASNFSEGLACVVSENGKIKYIDKTGQYKIELQEAEFAGDFHCGLAKVKIRNKWGFIDKSGNVLIRPQFDNVVDFTEEIAAFMNKNSKGEKLWGFIDKTGKILVNAQYKSVEPFKEGVAAVTNDGSQFGYIDKAGKYAITPQFESVTSFFNGIAAVKLGNNWGIINNKGKVIVNPQYTDVILPAVNNLIAVKNDNRWGYVNPEGKVEINPQFDTATNFIGKIAIVGVSGKIGFIDSQGKFTANPQFDDFDSPFNYSGFGVGYTFSQIESDFFDINLFTNKIFTNNKPFNVDSITTIENISLTYNLKPDNFNSKRVVEIKKNENFDEFNTKDIYIEKITIFFNDDAYHTDDKYDSYKDYWGITRQRLISSTKILNNKTKISSIEAIIGLQSKGEGKGKDLADNIKSYLVKAYKLEELNDKKFDEEKIIILVQSENNYFAYIKYTDNYIAIFISFNKEDNKKSSEQLRKLSSPLKS